MNLKALTEQKVEKQNEMEKLLDTVKTEKRAFTDEESKLFTHQKQKKKKKRKRRKKK